MTNDTPVPLHLLAQSFVHNFFNLRILMHFCSHIPRYNIMHKRLCDTYINSDRLTANVSILILFSFTYLPPLQLDYSVNVEAASLHERFHLILGLKLQEHCDNILAEVSTKEKGKRGEKKKKGKGPCRIMVLYHNLILISLRLLQPSFTQTSPKSANSTCLS